jgi:hypothetical protein
VTRFFSVPSLIGMIGMWSLGRDTAGYPFAKALGAFIG